MTDLFFDISAINAEAEQNPARLISLSEEYYNREIKKAAEAVQAMGDGPKLLMLSGPSASGKTTSARKIAEYLRGRGVQAVTVSLDDFYLGVDQSPVLEDGTPDFETIHALDLPLINACFLQLIKEGRARLPRFDFTAGARSDRWRDVSLGENAVAIVEGIHALNPSVTESLPTGSLLTLYVSVQHGISDRGDMLLSSYDVRLIRRMIRDFHHRASSPSNTLSMWSGVLRGEQLYLRPYKDGAKLKINSLLRCEPGIYRKTALEMLSSVSAADPNHSLAAGLKRGITRFIDIDPSPVPDTSVIREFIGGSVFEY
ncbi:MAG: nucleoside kinase [Oscillospiraceae bacterium]|nr:nucleoside kinase [Oscillospiraceae bacterium]